MRTMKRDWLSRVRLYPRRLLRAPALRPLERTPTRSLFAVEGLVCGLCAARTQRALAAVEGAGDVAVDLANATVELRHPGGSAPSLAALSVALEGVVIAGGARRALAAVAARFAGDR